MNVVIARSAARVPTMSDRYRLPAPLCRRASRTCPTIPLIYQARRSITIRQHYQPYRRGNKNIENSPILTELVVHTTYQQLSDKPLDCDNLSHIDGYINRIFLSLKYIFCFLIVVYLKTISSYNFNSN